MEDKKLKILIADDEDGLRLSMAGIIELDGHEVITAADGYEAVEHAKNNSFDIAFLDIKMPGIDGVETFKQIKKVSPETVVVMMTAYAVQHLIKEAIKEGAYACLSKPFDMDKIMTTIKDVSQKPFVVVIEDDATLCETFGQRFKEQGLNVITRSSDTSEGELLTRKTPDIIFLDISGDQKASVETFSKMKQSLGDKCPKVVMFGNDPSAPCISEIKKIGNAEFVQKPKNMDDLKKAIDKFAKSGKKLKLCLVDDDKPLCDSLKSILTEGGYDVDAAYSGADALKIVNNSSLKDDPHQIVILDVRLPDVNGLEIYEKIKSVHPGMGVIFISGFAQNDGIDNTISKNNYVYLHKPFDPENLLKMIDHIKETKLKGKA